MRQKKIRGHKRKWKEIEKWRLTHLGFNLTDYLLNYSDRYYVKIRVHPWSGLSLINSVTPQPTRKTKRKMIEGLLDIYEDWKTQLDNFGQPYYLKIWFFEPHFSNSQVVCAIGSNIDFYENTFSKSKTNKMLKTDNYGQLKNRLDNFTWGYRLEENHYANTEVGEPEMYVSRQAYEDYKKWFSKLLKKPHQTHILEEPMGDITEIYSFKLGNIWLGQKN